MNFTRTKIEEYSDSIADYCNNEFSRQGKNLKVVAVYSEAGVPIEGRMIPRLIAHEIDEKGTIKRTFPLHKFDVQASYFRYKCAKEDETVDASEVFVNEYLTAIEMLNDLVEKAPV